MLIELWKYFTTSCSAEARRMGYLSELIAIESRFQRRRLSWLPHLARCCEFIRGEIEPLPGNRRRTALVCGAGLCNDIPVAEVASRFETVVLVDLLFLRSTLTEIASYRNVKPVRSDVTGGMI